MKDRLTIAVELRFPPPRPARNPPIRFPPSPPPSVYPPRNHPLLTARRSIDARQRRVMVNLSVRLWIDEEPSSTSLIIPVDYKPLPADAPQAIVVGAGPAGLFAALRLIELGIRPIVLERGKDVDSRRKDMARISRENVVDPDSNYCFGEGGAGAYSDGKLYTRSKKRGPWLL